MAIVITSASTKGGTGKTSLIKFLSIVKREQGQRVLVIDLCQNSDIATRLGYKREDFMYDTADWVMGNVTFKNVVQHDEETGIDFIPASNQIDQIVTYAEKKRFIKREWILDDMIEPLRPYYDVIFLDTHPSEKDPLLTYALVASSFVLVPTILDISSIVATMRTVSIIESLQKQGIDINYRVVPMAVDLAKGFKRELMHLEIEFQEQGIHKMTSPIRASSVVARDGIQGRTVNKDNKYIKKVMDDYRQLVSEIDEVALPKQMTKISYDD